MIESKPTSKSPLRWLGSKQRMASKLLAIFRGIPRKNYVEPFGGSGVVFCYKTPDYNEIYNDLNGLLVNFFRVIRTPEGAETLSELSNVFPSSREMFVEMKSICKAEFNHDHATRDELIKRANLESYSTDVVLAWAFFYVQNTGFGGKFLDSYGGGVIARADDSHVLTNDYRNKCAAISAFSRRFHKVSIENLDAFACVQKYDSGQTLFYLDPPYNVDVSKQYSTSWSSETSERLVNAIINAEGSVVLSCYDSEIYEQLLTNGFERRSFETSVYCCQQKRDKRIETIYFRLSKWAINEKEKEFRNEKSLLFNCNIDDVCGD